MLTQRSSVTAMLERDSTESRDAMIMTQCVAAVLVGKFV
jgi:hypothetical protein